MKKFVAVFAVVLFVGALVVPVIAQAQQSAPAAKGTEGPDVRKQEPKGTEGPDVRKSSKKTATSPAPPKVQPKGTEGPGIRKQAPKGTEGPDERKSEKKS
jgi:hypothetical protein